VETERLDEFIRRYEEVYLCSSRVVRSMISEQAMQGLTHEQFYLLRILKMKGTSTPSDLAESCYVNRSAITSMMNRLVAKGYVRRFRDEKDRRIVLLEITEEGNAIYSLVLRNVHKFVESIINQFSEREIEEFLRIYEKIAQILSEQMRGVEA